MSRLSSQINKYFLTGLIVLGPLALTVLVVQWFVGTLDGLILGLLPEAVHPRGLFGMDIPGFGLVGTLVLVLVVGMLMSNIFGRTLVSYSEWLFSHTPGIKGVYQLFKQVTDTLLRQDKSGFRKAVLVEYPRREMWTVAFLTGTVGGELRRRLGQGLVSVYVPTTPNPTSGFYLLLPHDQVRELDMSVDEAFKLVVSVGMVAPPDRSAATLGEEDGV